MHLVVVGVVEGVGVMGGEGCTVVAVGVGLVADRGGAFVAAHGDEAALIWILELVLKVGICAEGFAVGFEASQTGEGGDRVKQIP